MTTERTYTLDCTPLFFSGWAFDHTRAIVFAWKRLTTLENTIWLRLWSVRWHWPPIMTIGAFTDNTVVFSRSEVEGLSKEITHGKR